MGHGDVLFRQAFQNHFLTGHLEVGERTDVVHDVNGGLMVLGGITRGADGGLPDCCSPC